MQQVQLFGSGVKSYSPVVTSQRRLNCFYDIRADGDENQTIIRGTPGWTQWLVLPTSPVRGWHVAGAYLYVVAGAVVYKVSYGGTATSLGTIATSSQNYVSITDNGVQLIIVDGVGGYIVTLATGSLVNITDAAFPNGATTVTFLDGRFVVNKASTKQYYISSFYDGTTWSPSIYASKENSPDYLVAVEVLNGLLVLWGANSIEFWQDVGASPNPFARINGASQSWGLAAVWSRAQIANTVMFLAQNPQGSVQVMMLNGYTPVRVSTTDIENIINGFTTFSDGVALTYMVDGHPMYQLTFPNSNRSFLYDTSTGLWQDVQTGLAISARHFGTLGVVFNSENYISDSTTGGVYAMNANVYTDAGQPIKRQVVSMHINMGGNKFGVDSVFLDMETGVGLQNGQGNAPMIAMQVSKDGGRTFSYERLASLGQVGQYLSPRVIFRRLGMSRSFVFKFTMTDPVKFVIGYAAAKLNSLDGSTNG